MRIAVVKQKLASDASTAGSSDSTGASDPSPSDADSVASLDAALAAVEQQQP